jgi:DHA1 family L-arabinose/isopropyl-beta-D-thiogalactopyranoside export protein-like MFS transporter
MPSADSPRSSWLAVVSLALAAFVFNTTEFVPVGLLSAIAETFSMPVERVGLMLTIYAWAVAILSLPCMLLTRDFERRGLLQGLFALFIASHVLCAVAWSFAALMAGRLGIALAHSVFWSITASLAVRLAPQGRQAAALSLLAAGTSIAMVLGIPIGRLIGEAVGWRATFGAIGVMALAVMLCLAQLLPPMPSHRAGSLSSLSHILRHPALMALYLLTIIVITAHFVAYTYIEPFIQSVAGLAGRVTTIVLLLSGGAGLPASLLFSRFYRPRPQAFLLISIGALALCLLGLRLAGGGEVALEILSVVWGMAIIAFGLATQAMVLRLSPDATDVAMSLYSGLYNVGIGGGAVVGSQISMRLGMDQVGYWGGVLCLLGLGWACLGVARGAVRPGVAA